MQEPGDHVLDVHTPDLVLVAPSTPSEVEGKPKPAKNRKKSGKKSSRGSQGSRGSRGSPDHVS